MQIFFQILQNVPQMTFIAKENLRLYSTLFPCLYIWNSSLVFVFYNWYFWRIQVSCLQSSLNLRLVLYGSIQVMHFGGRNNTEMMVSTQCIISGDIGYILIWLYVCLPFDSVTPNLGITWRYTSNSIKIHMHEVTALFVLKIIISNLQDRRGAE